MTYKTTIPAVGLTLLLTGGMAVAWAAPASAEAPVITEVVQPDGSILQTTTWLTEPPEGDGWVIIESAVTVEQDAVPGFYAVTEWRAEPPGDGLVWEQVGERYVVDEPEQLEHGTPTIMIENDEYRPATPGTEDTVVTTYVKWVWTGDNQAETPAFTGTSPWNKTSDTNPNKHDPLDVVYKTGGSDSNASWAIYVGTTTIIPGTPGTDAIGEPFIEVPNDEYVPYKAEVGHMEYMYRTYVEPIAEVSYTEYRYARTLSADPVVPPVTEEEVVTPPIEEEVVTPPIEEAAVMPPIAGEAAATEAAEVEAMEVEAATETLAETGAEALLPGVAAAAALIGLGGIALAGARKRETEQA